MSTVSRFPPLQVSSLVESERDRPRSHEIPRQAQEDGESSKKPRPKSQELPTIRGASGWRKAKSRVVPGTRAGRDPGLSLRPPPHKGRSPSPGLRARSGWEKQDGDRTPSEEMDDRNRSSRNRFYRTAAMATRSQTLLDINRHLVPSNASPRVRQQRDDNTSSRSGYQEKEILEKKHGTKIDEAMRGKYDSYGHSTVNVTRTSSTDRLAQENVRLREETLYSPLVNEISRTDCKDGVVKEGYRLMQLEKKQQATDADTSYSTLVDKISREDGKDRKEKDDHSQMQLSKKQQATGGSGVETSTSTLANKISREDGKDREQVERHNLIHLTKKQQSAGAETSDSATLVDRYKISHEDGREDSSLPLAIESTGGAYLSAGLSYGYKLWNEISRWGNQDSSRFSNSLKLLNRIESGIGNMLGERTAKQAGKSEEKAQIETENSLRSTQNSENTSCEPLESALGFVNEGTEVVKSEEKEQTFEPHRSGETNHTTSTNLPKLDYSKRSGHAKTSCQKSYDDYYVTTLEDNRPRHPKKDYLTQKNGSTVVNDEVNTYEDYFISFNSRSKFKRV